MNKTNKPQEQIINFDYPNNLVDFLNIMSPLKSTKLNNSYIL